MVCEKPFEEVGRIPIGSFEIPPPALLLDWIDGCLENDREDAIRGLIFRDVDAPAARGEVSIDVTERVPLDKVTVSLRNIRSRIPQPDYTRSLGKLIQRG